MGIRYCEHCAEFVETRVLPDYSHKKIDGVWFKHRKIIHRVEDGGCGGSWYTDEGPTRMIEENNGDAG